MPIEITSGSGTATGDLQYTVSWSEVPPSVGSDLPDANGYMWATSTDRSGEVLAALDAAWDDGQIESAATFGITWSVTGTSSADFPMTVRFTVTYLGVEYTSESVIQSGTEPEGERSFVVNDDGTITFITWP